MAELALIPLLRDIGLDTDMEKSDLPAHYKKLQSYVACMAYGGALVEDPARFAAGREGSAQKFRVDHVQIDTGVVVIRWDSWRWWESLAAGCLTFHLNFEKYGFDLPVMPEPWVHYVPIDLSDIRGTVERLETMRPDWGTIGENGRKWAIEHYSPIPVARRFVDLATRFYGTAERVAPTQPITDSNRGDDGR